MTPAAQAAFATTHPMPAPDAEFDRLLRRDLNPIDLLDAGKMDTMLLLAEQLANSKLSVPEHLRGNIGDCLAIVTQAMLWNMNPFAVAQKTHLVSGRLGYEAQLVIAVVMNSGAIRGGFRYEYRGENGGLECRVGAVLRGDGEITWGEWLKSSDVTTKNSPLWKTNPRQQLGYLQAKNWSRLHVPGAILGVYSTDELEDSPLPPAGTPSAAPAPRGPQRKSSAAVDPETGETSAPPASTPAPTVPPAAASAAGQGGTEGITVGQANYLRGKLKATGGSEEAACERYGVTRLEEISLDAFDELKSELLGKA